MPKSVRRYHGRRRKRYTVLLPDLGPKPPGWTDGDWEDYRLMVWTLSTAKKVPARRTRADLNPNESQD